MIVFKCARCREQLEVPSSMAGDIVDCPNCGNTNPVPTYVAVAIQSQARCSRVVYILLGIFLGAFGIHNFVAGYTGRAVAQLLITILLFWLVFPILFVWLWVIIELITVTRDVDGARMP